MASRETSRGFLHFLIPSSRIQIFEMFPGPLAILWRIFVKIYLVARPDNIFLHFMCFSVCLSAKWAIAPNATLQICTFFISSDRSSLRHGALFQATFSDWNICASIYWFWAFMSTVLEFFSLQLSSVLPIHYIKFNQRGWTMLFFLQHRVWISLLDAYMYNSGGTWTFFA